MTTLILYMQRACIAEGLSNATKLSGWRWRVLNCQWLYEVSWGWYISLTYPHFSLLCMVQCECHCYCCCCGLYAVVCCVSSSVCPGWCRWKITQRRWNSGISGIVKGRQTLLPWSRTSSWMDNCKFADVTFCCGCFHFLFNLIFYRMFYDSTSPPT